MGFVQADPIRAPARAQDLILRSRVPGYVAGALDESYPALGAEEDFFYAYGFTTTTTHRLLHPRGGRTPTGSAAKILEFVREHPGTHPRDLVKHFGARRRVNAWGGESRATTRVLELLHYKGYLRVVRRERGIRLFAAARERGDPLPPAERLRRLALQLASNFAPLPKTSLQTTLYHLRYGAPSLTARGTIVDKLLKARELESGNVDGVLYVWPVTSTSPHSDVGRSADTSPSTSREVRFLAPFDPIVWNRRRLEHLWHWDYRFEAYTPVALRRFGYYALPILYSDDFVGWVNISRKGQALDVARHFRTRPLRDRSFIRAFDAEVARFEHFLNPECAYDVGE